MVHLHYNEPKIKTVTNQKPKLNNITNKVQYAIRLLWKLGSCVLTSHNFHPQKSPIVDLTLRDQSSNSSR